MPQKSNEVWKIRVGNENFFITGSQKNLLDQAVDENKRWFKIKDTTISVPHIEYIVLEKRTFDNRLEAPKKNLELTSEQKIKAGEMIKKIRKERASLLSKKTVLI